MSKHFMRRAALVLTLATGLVVAGCGDDGDETDSTATDATTPVVTDATVDTTGDTTETTETETTETTSDVSGDSPSEVVEAFYQATADQDVETMCSLITEDTADQAAEEEGEGSCEASAEKGLANEETASIADTVEVGEETINGDTAVVAVSSSEAGGEGEINLVVEDGEWKIDFAA